MKKRISLIITFFLALSAFAFTACDMQTSRISKELGVDLSSGKQVANTENHGGFHGDGMTYSVLEFSNDEALRQIQENQAWSGLPLDRTATALVYGLSDTTTGISIGPIITDGQGAALIPQIQNGYYILIDRHAQKEETDMLDRASFNFTLGIYDSDEKILYYCKFDT